jgi:hypothetical protein
MSELFDLALPAHRGLEQQGQAKMTARNGIIEIAPVTDPPGGRGRVEGTRSNSGSAASSCILRSSARRSKAPDRG